MGMNAKEARERTKITSFLKNEEEVKDQYSEIKRRISNRVESGEWDVWYEYQIFPEVKRKLKEEGFKIENTQNEYKISWA
jgi:hypothetical protein